MTVEVNLKRMFKLSEESEKTKFHLLIISGVSLFIALTESLPTKVAVLGLDFSKNQNMVVLFILGINAYLLLRFKVKSGIEFIQHYLPRWIAIETSGTTGELVGLTGEECLQHMNGYEEDEEFISNSDLMSAELESINNKNQKITYKYKNGFIKAANFFNITFEVVGPIVFSYASMFMLCNFLQSTVQ